MTEADGEADDKCGGVVQIILIINLFFKIWVSVLFFQTYDSLFGIPVDHRNLSIDKSWINCAVIY